MKKGKTLTGYVCGIRYSNHGNHKHGSEQLMDTNLDIMVGYGKRTKVFKNESSAKRALSLSEHAYNPTGFVRPYLAQG